MKSLLVLAVLCGASLAVPTVNRVRRSDEAAKGQFPWMVLIQNEDDIYSVFGGSIVSEHWVLTKASCVNSAKWFKITFGEEERTSSKVVIQDDYRVGDNDFSLIGRGHDAMPRIPGLSENDIALLYIENPILFNSNVQPVRLASSVDVTDSLGGKTAIIAGWARTFEAGPSVPTTILRYAEQTILQSSACSSSWGLFGPYLHKYVCSISTAGIRGPQPRFGDDGNPLFVQEADGSYTQIGIYSTGVGQTEMPLIYTNVASYHDWIQSKTGV